MHTTFQEQYLRFAAVREITGLSRSTIWRLERNGDFPQSRKLSANAIGWLASEVMAWCAARAKIESSARGLS